MSVFEEIRSKLDIVEVISEYLPLKRVGSSYATRCPFHPDSTPSFYVSPSRQIWKCFGCGKGGDVIKFVAEYENIPYAEAARLLAERYNLDVKIGPSEREGKYYSALRKLIPFYKEQLVKSKEAKDYLLKERKFSPYVVEDFKLGYASDGFLLAEYAKREGIFDQLLELKHLFKTPFGKYRDFFYNRITIPIKNITSKVVAFGGRSFKGELPKYKNSPNSPIFQKEKTLFGVNRAKEYLKDRDYLIVVEGYFDVIRLHSVGFGNSVAPLGTALTFHHGRAISRLTKRVVLLFDGDSAGLKAALEGAKRLLKFPLQVDLCFLPEGEDPDSFVLKRGVKALRELLQSATPLQNFLIERIKNSPLQKREQLINLYREMVSSIADPLVRELWVKEFRNSTGLNLFGKNKKVFIKKVEPPKGLKASEVDFLLGLLFLDHKEEIDLKEYNLSPQARKIAEAILKGEKEKLPSWLFEMDTFSLEKRFSLAREQLAVEFKILEETFKTLWELERKVKEGKASQEELATYVKLLGELSEGEKLLYRRFKEKFQTL